MIRFTLLIFTLFLSINLNAQCTNLNTQFTLSQNTFCGAGAYNVALTNTSTGINNDTATYDWYLDGTFVETTHGLTAPVDFLFSTVGTYEILLVGTDTIPCSDSATAFVNIYPTPNANFTFGPNNGCAELPVNFTNTSTGTVTSTTYSWNFGDGATSTDENPTHTYAAGGSYTVTLTIQNAAGCSSTITQTVDVMTVPISAGLTGDDGDGNTNFCLLPGDPTNTETVNFSSNTTGAVSYFWDFDDGNTSTNPNPTHTYTNYGTFNVTMTATGPNGCSITRNITVVFERFVSASLTLNVTEYSGCTPFSLTTLTNNSINANSFVWNFGDGTPPITTTSYTAPNHVYTQPGNYTISLSASNSCNTANATISPIIIVGKPHTNFAFSGYTGCAPATLNFSNSTTGASPANAYTWDMGNGNTYTTTVTPPTQQYDSSGTYTVTLTASNACGDSTITRTIVLDTIPQAQIDILPTTEGCSPMTFNINNNSFGHITYYRWYLDGSVYSTSPTIPPFNYSYPPGNSPVSHTISLTVGNGCGISTDAETMIIHRPTLASFSASPKTICLGESINLTNNSLGENLTYDWDFGDGTTSTSSGNPTITYLTPGTYTIQLIAHGYCGNDTATQTVVVNPIPVADFTPYLPSGCEVLDMTFTNNSTTTASHSWTFGTGSSPATSSAINPGTVSYSTPGTQEIILTVTENGCTDADTNYIDVFPIPTVNFTLSPNEGCADLNVNFNNTSPNSGTETFDWNLGNGTNFTGYNPGNQIYTAINNDSTYTVKLIVTSADGCTDSLTEQIIVHPVPVADFTPDLPSGCEVLGMTFTNNSTTTASHSWTFGTGSSPATSSAINPGTVSYSTPGTQEVILTVTENGCTDADTNYIDVFPIPVVNFTLSPNEGCADLNVNFNNTSPNSGTETFDWNLGNGTNFTGYNPGNQIYTAINNDSTYTVKLIVTSADGCTDSLTEQIIVHPVPVADFTLTDDTICQNEAATFVNNSTSGMTYNWNFGDGNSSSLQNPTYTYSNPGNYTIQLIVSTPFACADTLTRDIVVLEIPVANFSATTACFGYNSDFTDLSTGTITDWNWDFGDGNTSTLQNPSHIYGASGSYSASLTVTNNLSCVATFSNTVNVNTVPVADFSIADSCLGDATAFNNLTSGATTGYEWNFDDGSLTNNSANPTHTFANTGTYFVSLIAFGGSGCADTITKPISINPVPTAGFNFTAVCMNDTTYFTNTSLGNPDTFFWDFGNGTTDNTNNQTPSIIYTNDGTFNVSLTVSYTLTGCDNEITQAVNSHPRTLPQFNATTECLNDTTHFTDQTGNSPTQWQWNFGDGSSIDFNQNPTHVYANQGTYLVQLITENIFGCSDTIAQNVTINPLPIAAFDYDTVCLNAPTSFTNLSSNAIAWNYDFGDGTSSTLMSPTHLFSSDGNHTVQLIVTNSFSCFDTTQHTIIVHPNPTAQFTADTSCFSYPTTFVNNSVGAVSSAWDFDDLGNTSTQTTPIYTFSEDGTFTPTLIVENIFGCKDTTTNNVLVLPQPQAGFISNTVCAKDVVTFTDTSYGVPSTFTWNFGDGTGVFNGSNVTHTYTVGGFYDINYIVQNNAGCADTITKQIQVFTVPVPNFEADTVCLFSITHFTDLTTDSTPLTSWFWDLGDGNTSPNQNPTYIYQNSGTYNVTLTVTNQAGCDSTITKPVMVSLVPVADFTYTVDCFGVPTTFTDQSTNNPGIYLWDFGDGTSINGNSIEQHTYVSPGVYTVELQVLGSDSVCSDSKTEIITIAGGAQADFLIPAQICVNDVFNFYDNSSTSTGTIASYHWDMGDGTIYTVANGTHAYSAPGIYQVTLTIVTSNGCQATYSESIEVLGATTADFSWQNTCENALTQFTNTSTGGTTNWYWNFGDGATSQTQFPNHTFTSAGNYNVMLVVQNLAGCSDTTTQIVAIDPTPTVDFSTDTVCYGDLTQFTNLSSISSGTIDQYQWIFGNNEGASNLENPLYEFSSYTQTHDVTLIATTDKGCSDTIIKPVSLLPIVVFNFDLGNHFGCAPVTVFFDNQSTLNGAQVLNYFWNFGDGDSSFIPSPTHTFAQAGNYPVNLTVITSTDCKLVASDSLYIEVFPSPTAGFEVKPPITSISHPSIEIINDAVGATSWEYDLGDGNYSNAANFSHIYNDVGNYVITQYIKNDFGCVDSTRLAIEVRDEFTLFVPNAFTPDDMGVNNYFTWSVSGYQTFEIRIFNRWGVMIYTTKDPFAYWDGTYRGEKVQDGVYVWKVVAIDLNGDSQTQIGHVTVLK